MMHGIDKCRVCDNYLGGLDTCKFCHFEWATDYSPTNDVEWDLLDLDDEVEWSFLQIQDRLKYKGIDCLQVINWFDDNVIVLIGIRAYADRVANALGVHREVISEDSDVGIMVINLFREKYLRGDVE